MRAALMKLNLLKLHVIPTIVFFRPPRHAFNNIYVALPIELLTCSERCAISVKFTYVTAEEIAVQHNNTLRRSCDCDV